MIAGSPAPVQPAEPALPAAGSWRRLLADAVTTREELLALVGLDPAAMPAAGGAAFRLRVPRGFVARMRPGDPDDPLLRQVLPVEAEDRPAPEALRDPVGDAAAEVLPGVLAKYAGRVLLVTTGACAVHCRYCFRRHWPYGEAHAGAGAFAAALDWLAGAADVDEVILSGGDPLSQDDARLAALVERLDALPHLARLRIHTRLPIVLPERVDGPLLAWLQRSRLRRVVVVHANHAREIDAPVAAALGRLAATGTTLLNQSVLLAGVNDSAEALAALSIRLFEVGVLPYYLHQLDRVQGACHYAVPDERARAIAEDLGARLPGYLVPRLVREVPGQPAKQPLPQRAG